MTFNAFVFWFFSAILVFAALRVITARNPVHAALYLVLAFCTSAAIWMQLQAEFLADFLRFHNQRLGLFRVIHHPDGSHSWQE